MQEIITPADKVAGLITLPGDKSISHRYAMLASIAEGTSKITNYSTGADCQSMLGCMEALGTRMERPAQGEDDGAGAVVIHGGALREPAGQLDAGNSGSIMRMLTGILAGQPFTTRIGGDESVSRRPMRRIIEPLTKMGASIESIEREVKGGNGAEGGFPPLTIRGSKLRGIDYTLPVASAQVKSCVLLAGLMAEGETVVRERIQTRDHTELALREFGADIDVDRETIRLQPGAKLTGRELLVPGDLSSACFFLVAALMAGEADLAIRGVGMNPTRAGLLDLLVSFGAQIKIVNVLQTGGELIGDLRVKTSQVQGGTIAGAMTAAVIDEIPALAVLGAVSEQGLTVRDARELRVKETDRIATVAAGLEALGVRVETFEDGFHVPGKQRFRAGTVDSAGDHRIAMAFAVAGLAADGPVTIEDAGSAAVSFPEFFDTLRQIAQ